MTNRDAFISRWNDVLDASSQTIEQYHNLQAQFVDSVDSLLQGHCMETRHNYEKEYETRIALQAKFDRVTELVGGLRAAALAAESLSHTAYAQDYQRGLSHAYASSADDLEQALKEVEK